VNQSRSPFVRAASIGVFATAAIVSPWFTATSLAQGQQAIDNSGARAIPFDVDADFLKYPATLHLGEVLGVAVNSKGNMVVLNHPGSSNFGPLYGNSTTQLLEFGKDGKLLREIGQGVYGLGYAHSVRFDKYDNLWVVDKGTNSAMKFNPEGRVTLNLGRRPEGYEFEPHHPAPAEKVAVDGYFDGPTDIGWDTDDNVYISEGYVNNRVTKFDKHGNWIKAWGKFGPGGDRANENPGSFRNAHNMQIDRQNNVYVADRANRRIQVFDRDGRFLRFLFLNVPYDKTRQPVLGNKAANPPDETSPWALCITNTTPQYLYAADTEPGRLYKMTLDGKILGYLGESGHQVGQFNWVHGLACPTENEVIVADMNNWRVQKVILHPERSAAGSAR
jgi:hypothetical protein